MKFILIALVITAIIYALVAGLLIYTVKFEDMELEEDDD